METRTAMSSNIRELAMFNLAIDSKLRACDLTQLLVQDICQGSHVGSRTMENATTGPVRNHGADSAQCRSLDRGARGEACRLSLSESAERFATSFDPAICSAGPSLDCVHRARRRGIWHTHRATDKGFTDLPTNEESRFRIQKKWFAKPIGSRQENGTS